MYSSVYGACIAREITGGHYSLGHPALPDDPQASLRAQLAAKISGAQFDLENQLAKLRNMSVGLVGSDALAQLQGQLGGLSQLQQRIARADPAALIAIRGEVAAYVAATQAMVQQAQPAAASLKAGELALREASEAARRTTTDFMHDYYDRHQFDPYLRFASTKDEEDFREHEEERKHAIEKALAERTPQGNLRASELAIEQLKDAGAHRADRSPQYQPTLDKLNSRTAELRKEIDRQPNAKQNLPSAKEVVPTDPMAALRAAGVGLADDGGATPAAPRGAGSARTRT